MGRIREIEVSALPPSKDKLWMRLQSGDKCDILCYINGDWVKVTTASSSSSGSVSDEELEEIEQRISDVETACAAATKTANAATTAATKAQTTAESATTAAASATTAANEAKTEAAAATKNYNTLANQISTVETTANKAASDVLDAKSDAKTAAADAKSALEIANNLNNAEVNAKNVKLESDNSNLTGTSTVLSALEKIAAKVWYEKIAISSFTATPTAGTFEVGASVSAPTFTWSTTKTPAKTVINGVTQSDPTVTKYTMSSAITATKTVTLTVTESDEQAATASKSLTWTFGYGIYTGMATVPSSFTQDWIKNTLGGKVIKTTAAGSYTMKGSTTSQYWWLVVPTAWTIAFKTSLGSGGAEKVGTVASFVNDQGKTVSMSVYRASKVQGSDMAITVTQ